MHFFSRYEWGDGSTSDGTGVLKYDGNSDFPPWADRKLATEEEMDGKYCVMW